MTSPCTIPWQTESTDDIKDNRAHDLLSIGGITSAIRASLEADDSQWQINVLPYVTRLLNTSSLVNDNHVVVADDSNDCSARKMMAQDRITCMEVLEDVTVSHSMHTIDSSNNNSRYHGIHSNNNHYDNNHHDNTGYDNNHHRGRRLGVLPRCYTVTRPSILSPLSSTSADNIITLIPKRRWERQPSNAPNQRSPKAAKRILFQHNWAAIYQR